MKLTKELLLSRIEAGNTQRQIAQEFSCSEGYVSGLRKTYQPRIPIEKAYIGKIFGNLTILSYLGLRQHRKKWFQCLCKCGQTINLPACSFVTGNTKSCGCSSRRRGKDHPEFRGYEEISMTHWWSIVNGAIDRELPFNITIKDAWELYEKQDRRCALTGRPIIFAKSRRKISDTTASLDRIDSKRGYEPDNIQWVHKLVNQMKWTLTQDDFIQVCREVVDYQGKH